MNDRDAIGSLEWYQSWAKVQRTALIEALRSAEAGTISFGGKFGPDEIADVTEALSDQWRCEQVRQFFSGDESSINLSYAPPKPGEMEEAFRKLDFIP